MANVDYWFASWVSNEGDELPPGGTHSWIAWPYTYGQTITVTATPLQGGEEQILAVENVQLQADPGGRRIFFNVRNVGNSFIAGYGMGFSYVSN
jgi:hypothetical protein